MINEITVKTALNKVSRKGLPFNWDLNIYRGCNHSCHYCYAIYSHKYLERTDYFNDILVKTNIVKVLERELSSKNWKRGVINIGGVCDSYQKAEKEYNLMPKILKLMIKYKNPVIISTKSSLILRDYELIKELSEITYVNIAATITTVDERIRKKIEPYSSPTEERFRLLQKFRDTSVNTGLHLMPIIPFLTDNEVNLKKICKKAAELKVNYILPGILYLRGPTRNHFSIFFRENFPNLYFRFKTLYKNDRIDKVYKLELYKMIDKLIQQNKLSRNYKNYLDSDCTKIRTLDEFLFN